MSNGFKIDNIIVEQTVNSVTYLTETGDINVAGGTGPTGPSGGGGDGTGPTGLISTAGLNYSDYIFWNSTTSSWTADTNGTVHNGSNR